MSVPRKFTKRRRLGDSDMKHLTVRLQRHLAESLEAIKGPLSFSAAFEKLIDAELRRLAKKARKAACRNLTS